MRTGNATNSLFSFLVLIATLLLPTGHSQAQTRGSKNPVAKIDSLKMKERWSLKTNAIDWLITIPNATVEFDLSASPYSKNTLSLTTRYNWQSSHTYKPNLVFDIFDAKLEFRNYWRTQQRYVYANDTTKATFWQKMKNAVSRRRLHPRTWRAYYLGGYVSGGTYSTKFGKEGKQGQYLGTGISFGYSVPLYGYLGDNLDIEFGASIGAVATKYDVYTRNLETNSYVIDNSKAKGWHVLPYPVVTDINVSLVYRINSIRDKYKLINYEKIERKQEEKRQKANYRDSVETANKIKERIERRSNEWKRDSLFRAKEISKELGATNVPEQKGKTKPKKKDKDAKESVEAEESKAAETPEQNATEQKEETAEEQKAEETEQ